MIDEIIPSLTASQHAARLREDRVMDSAYPGCYVAYVDSWSGDVLSRTIVVVAADPSEFHSKIAQLSLDLRSQVQLTLVPDTDEAIAAPSITLG
jgi:hypothetical protein